uniref:Uncharacterized protein n=1 Tax=Anguilla anguilla TaxID=7936 RepID=A0A0E9U9B9_ANGAN
MKPYSHKQKVVIFTAIAWCYNDPQCEKTLVGSRDTPLVNYAVIVATFPYCDCLLMWDCLMMW